jgi:hypothetical protein
VVNGEEQARVDAGETGKGLGVGPVGLSRIAVDRSELAGVGDQHLVS